MTLRNWAHRSAESTKQNEIQATAIENRSKEANMGRRGPYFG